jgi:hypothetical protein
MKSLSASRHRFRPGFERLEDRSLPAVTFTVNGPLLTITGNNADDVITLNDDGAGNLTLSATGVAGTQTVNGINQININTKKGNDFVTYNLNGTLTHPLSISADLKEGRDNFIYKGGNFDVAAALNLSLNGGAGDKDNLSLQVGKIKANQSVTATVNGNAGNGDISFMTILGGLERGASCRASFDGGVGKNDQVSFSLGGDLDRDSLLSVSSTSASAASVSYRGALKTGSKLLLDCSGGGEQDRLTADVTINADSTGGSVGDTGATAALRGKGDKDTLTFKVRDNSSGRVGVFALADGGLGKDKCTRTGNVTPSSCETDFVVNS